jgi:transcriptional regulator with XRE-family HTH domain
MEPREIGRVVRQARLAKGWAQRRVAEGVPCSVATVSRLENGKHTPRDQELIRKVAGVLGVPLSRVGLAATVGDGTTGEADLVRRRQLLSYLAVTAAAVAVPVGGPFNGEPIDPGDLLIVGVRDAVLGFGPAPKDWELHGLRMSLARAVRDADASRSQRLADELPVLIATGQAHAAVGGVGPAVSAVLARIYILTARVLTKLDEQQLGWMVGDRARVLSAGDPLAAGEAARNLAVLARKAGWYDQAVTIALGAAALPELQGDDPRLVAQRGLLVMSAAYTQARAQDPGGMRELTGQAAALAARLGNRVELSDHTGGFSRHAVDLHLISAEFWAGDPGKAVATARRMDPRALPTVERRARFHTDTARAYAGMGRREQCLDALLAAEHIAPEEIHTRPASRDLVRGLLLSGRTSTELRGLAARCAIT